MRPLLAVLYVLMAVWLVLAAARRIALLLMEGAPLDWSPFVSGGIGLTAFLVLLPALDDWSSHRE